jgi:hypothetical protein
VGAVKARTLLLLFLLSWGPIAFLAAVVLDSSGLFWASVGWTAMLGLPWSWWSASALPELSSVGYAALLMLCALLNVALIGAAVAVVERQRQSAGIH